MVHELYLSKAVKEQVGELPKSRGRSAWLTKELLSAGQGVLLFLSGKTQ